MASPVAVPSGPTIKIYDYPSPPSMPVEWKMAAGGAATIITSKPTSTNLILIHNNKEITKRRTRPAPTLFSPPSGLEKNRLYLISLERASKRQNLARAAHTHTRSNNFAQLFDEIEAQQKDPQFHDNVI